MDEYMKEALEIVKAQAKVHAMTEEEISNRLRTLADLLRRMDANEPDRQDDREHARRSIREKTILCLECGENFRVLTRRHLALHGMDPDEYRKKWGLGKDVPLACRALQRERRRRMREMRLWERRGRSRKDDALPRT